MLGVKINRFAFIPVLLIMTLILSGCYTLIGYPPDAKDAYADKDARKDNTYKEHEYFYYGSPYGLDYLDDYDLYYFYPSYPYYGRYFYNPWWYDGWHNDWNYWHNDNDYYVPNKKPEDKKRDASDFGRSPRDEQWRNDNADKQNAEADQQKDKDEENKRSPRRYRNEE